MHFYLGHSGKDPSSPARCHNKSNRFFSAEVGTSKGQKKIFSGNLDSSLLSKKYEANHSIRFLQVCELRSQLMKWEKKKRFRVVTRI